MKSHYWMIVAALLAAGGVTLGAYQAHGLQGWLEQHGVAADQIARRLDNAEVAVRYQMFHALGLLMLGSLLRTHPGKLLTIACALLLMGVVMFSGGLYVIVFAGNALHWSVVPAGGVILIVGWICAAAAFALGRGDKP